MRAVVQRVSRAAVRDVTTGEVLGSIGDGAGLEAAGGPRVGLCVLLGVGQGDTAAEAEWLADRVAGLRIFADADALPSAATGAEPRQKGNMNRSLREVGGELLVISQFTLYADLSRGRRPSFTAAMPPTEAAALYEHFVAALRRLGYKVATGRFGALMAVELINEGPVTLWLDTRESGKSAAKPAEPAGLGGSP